MKQGFRFMRRGGAFILMLALSVSLLMTPAYAADWPQFLGQEASQGVSGGFSATKGSELSLRWERNTGSTWNDVPGTPIVVGDRVYYYSSQYLRKLSLATGEELATAQVYGEPASQFFINIAYGDGMIFVPCQANSMNDGTGVDGCFFRVFDADTLKQLYVTESISKGQMQSPVMYHDGYFVTGTYGRNGRYAGFTSKDEDTSRGDEVKKASWIVETESKYGFSFNGAAFEGNYCYFGCGSFLYIVNYRSGEAQSFEIGAGYNICSTIVYSHETERLYVAANHPTDGASVISYELAPDGMPVASSALEWVSHTKGGGTQSTPVIYNGRLYIGGGGSTMSTAEPFHVIDAATMKDIYSVPVLTKGSAAISAAYSADANKQLVYLYLVPYAPKDETISQMWILTDSKEQTQAKYEVIDGIGHRQYCSQSVLIAHDGSLLWYNDAGRLYCYEKKAALSDGGSGVEDSAGIFPDTDSHWAKEQIAMLAEKSILSGTGNGYFSPDASITRAQFAQILANLSGDDFTGYTTDAFDDVKSGDWYAPAVAWAVKNSITSGSGAHSFSPNAQITRQDMASMLKRYLDNMAKIELPHTSAAIPFTDRADISAYALEPVDYMQTAGIINGIADGSAYRFAPKSQATRAQAATMIAKLYPLIYSQD
jgi:hypothetical protein